MIATQNQQVRKETPTNLGTDIKIQPDNTEFSLSKFKNIPPSSLVFQSRLVRHNPKAGLNPLVDSAGHLFSIIGKLKPIKFYRQLSKLQQELIQEIHSFQDAIKLHGYNPEYVVVCRYIMCATLDDIIANTSWGGGQWDSYTLLSTFNQDATQQDKFFDILERAIKEPALYIDLMELIYICLSLGYKGQYRKTEHSQYQLEQIIHNLYKHIRAFRGSFSKSLSPSSLKAKITRKIAPEPPPSILFIFCVTACIIMVIFISLSYLMDLISNEAYNKIKDPVSHEVAQQ